MQERAPEPREPDTDRAASSPAATYVRLFWPPTPRSAPATRGEHAVWEDEGGAILRADEHVEPARDAEDPSVAVVPSASRESASASQEVELRRASPAEIASDAPVEIAGASQVEVASDLQVEIVSNEPRKTSSVSSVSSETSVGVAQPLVAFVGTYPPRRCGLATFTADLSGALRALYRESEAQAGFAEGPRTSRRPHSLPAAASEGRAGGGRRLGGGHCPVVAMTDVQHGYEYPADVTFDVAEQSASSYADAIEQLNESDVDAISLQHEYGIFGGDCGSLVLGFYRRLRAPIVTTLHTVAPMPNPRQRAIMDEICVRSERLVVMSRGAAELLRRVHPSATGKVEVVPHGVPAVPTRADAKKELGLTGRTILLTFGLLSPGKGIEHVIEALPRIAADHPDVLYVVLGATHPRVRAEHGETYRQMLVTLTRRLRMEEHVVFHDRFVDAEELTTFLGAADVYLTPYLDLDQATSGTLAYAVGAGRATISSPYRYAEELLSEGRGRLVAAGDSDGIARGVCAIVSDAQLREDMERAAGLFGREMRWPVVASAYARIFAEVVAHARRDAASGVTRLRAGQRARRPSDRTGGDASELVRGDASSGGATEAARGASLADASELVRGDASSGGALADTEPPPASAGASMEGSRSEDVDTELPITPFEGESLASASEGEALLDMALLGREPSASSRASVPFASSELPSALSALAALFPPPPAAPDASAKVRPASPRVPWLEPPPPTPGTETGGRWLRSMGVGPRSSPPPPPPPPPEAISDVEASSTVRDGVVGAGERGGNGSGNGSGNGARESGFVRASVRSPERGAEKLRKTRRLPEVDLTHVRALTDGTGILQHAAWCIPRRDDGYCLDDNARALLLCMRLGDLSTWELDVTGLSARYLAFLHHAFDAKRGRFRNFLRYDRRWMEAVGSEDSHGRAVWALGAAMANGSSDGSRAFSADLFTRALPATRAFTSPRAWAYVLLGIEEQADAHEGIGETQRVQVELAERLLRAFHRSESPDWPWFEDRLSYANARLPQAMLLAGRNLENDVMIEVGLRALGWLCTTQEAMSGRFSPVGSNGFYVRGDVRAEYDQQPIEASSMISACLTAHRLTGDELWRERANRAFDWFIGVNHLGQWLYDPVTGGCRDGIHEDRVNQNQGAESTLSFLLAVMDMRAMEARDVVMRPANELVSSVIASSS